MAQHDEMSLFPAGFDLTGDFSPTPSTFQSSSPYGAMHRNEDNATPSQKQSNASQGIFNLGDGLKDNNHDGMKPHKVMRAIPKQDSTVSPESGNTSNAELWSRLNALRLTTTLLSSSQSEPDLDAINEVLVMPRRDYGNDLNTAGVLCCTFMAKSPPRKNQVDLRSYSL